MDKINVGLIGLGTVGTGVAKLLIDNADVIKDKLGFELVIKKAADQDLTRDRGLDLPEGVLTDDAEEVLGDPDISIVVELVGGTGIARDFTMKAIEAGKHVATANKALLSVHGEEIFTAARSRGVQVGLRGECRRRDTGPEGS